MRFGCRVGEYFEVRKGTKQGCVMFLRLFNIFFDRVVGKVIESVTRKGVKTERWLWRIAEY